MFSVKSIDIIKDPLFVEYISSWLQSDSDCTCCTCSKVEFVSFNSLFFSISLTSFLCNLLFYNERDLTLCWLSERFVSTFTKRSHTSPLPQRLLPLCQLDNASLLFPCTCCSLLSAEHKMWKQVIRKNCLVLKKHLIAGQMWFDHMWWHWCLTVSRSWVQSPVQIWCAWT